METKFSAKAADDGRAALAERIRACVAAHPRSAAAFIVRKLRAKGTGRAVAKAEVNAVLYGLGSPCEQAPLDAGSGPPLWMIKRSRVVVRYKVRAAECEIQYSGPLDKTILGSIVCMAYAQGGAELGVTGSPELVQATLLIDHEKGHHV